MIENGEVIDLRIGNHEKAMQSITSIFKPTITIKPVIFNKMTTEYYDIDHLIEIKRTEPEEGMLQNRFMPSLLFSMFSGSTEERFIELFADLEDCQEFIQSNVLCVLEICNVDIAGITRKRSFQFARLRTIEDCEEYVDLLKEDVEDIFDDISLHEDLVVKFLQKSYLELIILLDSKVSKENICNKNYENSFMVNGKPCYVSSGYYGATYFFEEGFKI